MPPLHPAGAVAWRNDEIDGELVADATPDGDVELRYVDARHPGDDDRYVIDRADARRLLMLISGAIVKATSLENDAREHAAPYAHA